MKKPIGSAPLRETDNLRVREVMPMTFGRFTVTQSIGSVEVEPHSGACKPLGVTMIRSTCERARFEVFGSPGSRVLVQVVVGESRAGQAAIDNIAIYPRDGIVNLDSRGVAHFYAGGRVSVPKQRKSNDIQANYSVQVNYLP